MLSQHCADHFYKISPVSVATAWIMAVLSRRMYPMEQDILSPVRAFMDQLLMTVDTGTLSIARYLSYSLFELCFGYSIWRFKCIYYWLKRPTDFTFNNEWTERTAITWHRLKIITYVCTTSGFISNKNLCFWWLGSMPICDMQRVRSQWVQWAPLRLNISNVSNGSLSLYAYIRVMLSTGYARRE